MELYVTEVHPVKERGVSLSQLAVGDFARLANDPECVVLKDKCDGALIVIGSIAHSRFCGGKLNGWRTGCGELFIPLKKGEAIAVGGE